MEMNFRLMKISIDGKEIAITNVNENIVMIAARNGIHITAPCFRSKNRIGGCCKVCLISVDEHDTYACGTLPQDGMNIIYNDDRLIAERKRRMNDYIKKNKKYNYE